MSLDIYFQHIKFSVPRFLAEKDNIFLTRHGTKGLIQCESNYNQKKILSVHLNQSEISNVVMSTTEKQPKSKLSFELRPKSKLYVRPQPKSSDLVHTTKIRTKFSTMQILQPTNTCKVELKVFLNVKLNSL